MRKLVLVIMVALVTFITATPPAFANEDHACKTDADCEHGHHCKDGHCHE